MVAGYLSLRYEKVKDNSRRTGTEPKSGIQMLRMNPWRPHRPEEPRYSEWAVNSGRPTTRNHRNAQKKPRSLRISEEEIRSSVLFCKVVISALPFVFVCRLFKGAENVQNNITVQILYFHLAVYSDSYLSCNRCVVSVSESLVPLISLLETYATIWGNTWQMSAYSALGNCAWCRLLHLTSTLSVSSLST